MAKLSARLAAVLALTSAWTLSVGAPPAAAAGSASVSRVGVLTFTGSAIGNNVSVTQSLVNGVLYLVITDSADTISAGANCTLASTHSVRCSHAKTNQILLNLGDGNDTASVSASVTKPSTLNGDNGQDTLTGGGGKDTLNGLAGFDGLSGGPGADQLSGGPGNDLLAGGDGDDSLTGGTGIDTATYAASGAGVDITLDGVADDGKTGERDNVQSDVENVKGSAFDDSILGNAAANRLEGLGGPDNLDGAGGNDTLLGGAGFDTLNGGLGGTDRCEVGANGGSKQNCEA